MGMYVIRDGGSKVVWEKGIYKVASRMMKY